MKRILRLIFLLAAFCASPAIAADRIVSIGVLEDATGAMGFDDVRDRAFAPIAGVLSRGYTDSAYWLKLRVRGPAGGGPLVLRLQPTFIDEIRLFEEDPDKPGTWRSRAVGDRHPFDARDLAATSPAFVVDPGDGERTYFLRVHTASTTIVGVDALTLREAWAEEHALSVAHALFIGLALAVLLWAVYGFFEHRDAVLGLFALYQAVFLAYGLAGTGFFAQFAGTELPGAVDWANNVLVLSIMPAIVPFTVKLFREYAPARGLLRGLYAFLLPWPALLLFASLGSERLALQGNSILFIVAHWYFVAVAISMRAERHPRRGFVLGVYLVLAVMVTVFNLAYLGLIPGHVHGVRSVFALVVVGSVTASLFIVLFHRRAELLRRERHDAEVGLAISNKALEYERRLKAQAEALANVDGLTELSNRRHFLEVAARELARAQRMGAPMSLLMIDIDFFKRVNDTRGHSVGDEALRAVARCLKETLREIDVVARFGGEEFAAILTEVGGATAWEVAERVRRAVEAMVVVPPEGAPVRVTISIGVTELRARRVNLDTLIREADDALYRAKNCGRNRVEVAGAP